VWRDTNPGLAHGYPDIDGLRKFVRESEHRPAQREVFKRSHLGMWLDSAAEPAFDLTVWDEGRETFDIVKLEGCKAWIGVDLSKVTDLCAASFVRSHRRRAFENGPTLTTSRTFYGAIRDT
jgi:phage terminase large subunit-like protein